MSDPNGWTQLGYVEKDGIKPTYSNRGLPKTYAGRHRWTLNPKDVRTDMYLFGSTRIWRVVHEPTMQFAYSDEDAVTARAILADKVQNWSSI